jgi:hypothetical protein
VAGGWPGRHMAGGASFSGGGWTGPGLDFQFEHIRRV